MDNKLQAIENPLEEKPHAIKSNPASRLSLSQYAKALLDSVKNIKKKATVEQHRLTVSRTVSFLAFVYEKVRNAVEYREEHLILRAAIERILKRRLALNPEAKGEGENLLRELVWARYFPSGKLGDKDVDDVQHIIDRYLTLRKSMLTGRDSKMKSFLSDIIVDLLTCEIEEFLNPEEAEKESTYMYFIYQILRQKIQIDDISEQQKDAFFLVGLDRSYRKSDIPYQRYHLFITFYKPLNQYDDAEFATLSPKLTTIFTRIENIIHNPISDRLTRFVRKELPSFLILFDIINRTGHDAREILSDKDQLWAQVEQTCRDKYSQTGSRLRNLAVRSLIYIFATKMILALIMEYPISEYFYGSVNWVAIAINTIFPPLLMLVIVLFVRLPGESNTKKIFSRIIDIVNEDMTFETSVTYKSKKPKSKRPMLLFGFTIFYLFTFLLTLYAIHICLKLVHFNLVSEAIFIFFVSVVTFFSYRIKQVANEYRAEERDNFFTPFVDVFIMPILSLGKFFSNEIGKLNFFILLFDFIIEAPFKLIFEIVEEWISFVRVRKEEIM